MFFFCSPSSEICVVDPTTVTRGVMAALAEAAPSSHATTLPPVADSWPLDATLDAKVGAHQNVHQMLSSSTGSIPLLPPGSVHIRAKPRKTGNSSFTHHLTADC
jgi:hypothetical protein